MQIEKNFVKKKNKTSKIVAPAAVPVAPARYWQVQESVQGKVTTVSDAVKLGTSEADDLAGLRCLVHSTLFSPLQRRLGDESAMATSSLPNLQLSYPTMKPSSASLLLSSSLPDTVINSHCIAKTAHRSLDSSPSPRRTSQLFATLPSLSQHAANHSSWSCSPS